MKQAPKSLTKPTRPTPGLMHALIGLVLSMLDNVVGLRLFSAVSGPNLRIPVQLVLLVIGVGSTLFWGMPLGFCNWLL